MRGSPLLVLARPQAVAINVVVQRRMVRFVTRDDEGNKGDDGGLGDVGGAGTGAGPETSGQRLDPSQNRPPAKCPLTRVARSLEFRRLIVACIRSRGERLGESANYRASLYSHARSS